MKKRIAVLLAALLCLMTCCALADDWGKAVVDAPSGKLHLRAEPTSKSDSLGLYFTGTQVTCKSNPRGEWVEVKIGRERGYMYGEYLKTGTKADRVSPRFWSGTVNATNYARLRKGPSTEYEFICKVPDGKNVTIMGETDEHWYYVKYGNEMGFISKNLVYVREEVWSEQKDNTPVYVPPKATAAPIRPVVPAYSAVPANWRSAYRAWVQQNGDDDFTYSLIYVNDDDIPELAVSTGAEAGGCQVLTYGAAGVQVLQTRRLHFTYIKRGNLLCNSDGHMDSYYDDVYAIENGRWKCIARGECYGYQGEFSEVLGRYICQNYVWNGQATTLAGYLVSLSQIYPENRAAEPNYVYGYQEIISLLAQ